LFDREEPMKVEIFGMGCARCRETERVIRDAAVRLRKDVEVVKVDDMRKIAERGIMRTPAVVVDGRKVCEGKVPSAGQALEWLK
jgi:small redox-active disulfide protein 2